MSTLKLATATLQLTIKWYKCPSPRRGRFTASTDAAPAVVVQLYLGRNSMKLVYKRIELHPEA
jgi:hypothetical protein